ncbi:MAG: hypothetical protein EAX96_20340 [Candidatus Lokiarchaeota archaeon]|nr:hypothetical protein [Candidatus Lokiarchaeota archaeon]
MTKEIQFHKEMIEKAESDYSKAIFHKDQKALVEPMAKAFIKYLPLSELAMRGFLSRAVSKWQKEHNKSLEEMHNAQKNEKYKAMNEILNDNLVEIMTKIVVKPEQVDLLKTAINEAANLVSKLF